MDCHKAQAQLDFTTLGQDAVGGSESLAAQRHLAECDACHQTFESQRRFDRRVAQAMSDVPLPPGLVERLSSAVGSAESVQSGAVPRRRALGRVGWGVAAVALLPFLIWVLTPRTPVLNQASVQVLAELDLNLLPVDSRQGIFSLPAGWSSLRDLQFGESPRLAHVNGSKIPVRDFLLQPDRRSPDVVGLLVRLPKSEWHATPDATSFSSATVEYASFGTWVVWREGDAVFLCILHDNAHAMQRLQDLLAESRDLT